MSKKVVIAGAGASGLTCAIYLAQAGWHVDVFSGEEEHVSCLAESPEVRNYPGFPEGIAGFDLLDKFTEQATKYGVKIHSEAIASINTTKKTVLDSYSKTHCYDEVVVASGVSPREFKCEGIEKISLHTCAVCDGSVYGRNDSVVVIGGGDTAVNSALYLSEIVGKVYMIVRKDYLRATNRVAVEELEKKSNVEIWYRCNVVSVSDMVDEYHVNGIGWNHDNHWITMDNGDGCCACAIFSCIGYDVNEIETVGDGKVWKCGDCVERHHQVAVAVGSGANVALDILGAMS